MSELQSVPPETAQGRLPNAVIAGVTKAGTTSLFRYLSQHPDVQPADEKEVRHFLPLRYGEPTPSLEEYAAHFREWRGQQIVMEASPGYFFGGRTIAEAMDAALPGLHVVVVLREPVARCRSFFDFMRSRAVLKTDADFGTWLDRAEALVAEGTDQERENHPWSGLGTGIYARWLGEWVEVFGPRLHVLWFDDLAARPQQVVVALCKQLGIDPAPAWDFRYTVENRSVQFRHKGLQKVALRTNKAFKLFFERHQHLKRAIRRAYYRFNRAPVRAGMSETQRLRLTAYYAGHVAALWAALPEESRTGAPAWARPGGADSV